MLIYDVNAKMTPRVEAILSLLPVAWQSQTELTLSKRLLLPAHVSQPQRLLAVVLDLEFTFLVELDLACYRQQAGTIAVLIQVENNNSDRVVPRPAAVGKFAKGNGAIGCHRDACTAILIRLHTGDAEAAAHRANGSNTAYVLSLLQSTYQSVLALALKGGPRIPGCPGRW